MWLRQSTAVTVKAGPFLDETDGKTQETALTISQADIRLTKNGGAYAQSNNAAGATHDEKGNYGVPLDTTDTDTLGTLRVHIHESGALPVWQDFMVVPANVWDSMFGADKLQVDAVEWLGGTIATPTVTGVPEVDLTHAAGTAITASAGRPEVNTTHAAGTAWASGAITAAVFAADAITAAKLAADVTTELQTGLATDAAVASLATSVGNVQTAVNTIDDLIDTEFGALVTTIGTPAGASIAADLLTIDNLVDDLESRLTATRAGYLDNLSVGAVAQASALSTAQTAITTILADTDNIQTRIPAALTAAGNIKADVEEWDAADVAGMQFNVNVTQIDAVAPAAAIMAAVGLASANLDSQLSTIDDLLDSEMGALQTSINALFTTALTESYRAAGAAPTMAQVAFELIAHHGDSVISGVTKTLRKINATTAKTFTLDSATTPVSITEAT